MRATTRFAFALGLVTLCPAFAHADDYVIDPVTDPVFAGRGVRGGSFSASGWTTQTATDTLWWEIPAALESGSVEFTLTGMSVGGSLVDSDNDIVTVYQAPDGQAEPIDYSPYFRNNDEKVFLRVFGAAEGAGRAGATKLNLTMCMQGPPYYHDSCPAGCPGTDTLAYANGTVSDLGWDPAHAYRMNISWGNGTMSFSRDGQLLASVSYPGTYAPQPMRVRIGGPRSGQVAGASTPVGITIADVAVRGTPGVQTPVCAPTPPPDSGTLPTDAGACDNAVLAVQDAVAASFEPGVFPDATDLNVEADATGVPTSIVYLRFPPAGGVVSQAILKLHTHAYASAAGGSGQICRVDSDAWDESSLTWANRPSQSTVCSGGAHAVDPDQEVQWDVTALIPSSGNVNLAVVSTDADGAHFVSREFGGCATGPRLYLQLAPPVTDSGVPPTDAAMTQDAGSTMDAATSADANTGRDANGLADSTVDAHSTGNDAGATTDTGTAQRLSNCGCSAPGRRASGAAGWLAAGAVVLVVRRRRTHPRG